jgi:hypothetical protein
MNKELTKKREEAITDLLAALNEINSGTEMTHFVNGHGLQSRYFKFAWNDPALGIDFRLPYDCVLSDAETQKANTWEIGAALRLAVLLLDAANRGALFQKGEDFLNISLDEGGAQYRIFSSEGDQIESGEGLEALVRRLEMSLHGNPNPETQDLP